MKYLSICLFLFALNGGLKMKKCDCKVVARYYLNGKLITVDGPADMHGIGARGQGTFRIGTPKRNFLVDSSSYTPQ